MTKDLNIYDELCQSLHIEPLTTPPDVEDFAYIEALAEKSISERLTAAIMVLVEMLEMNQGKVTINEQFIDCLIVDLDEKLSRQIQEVIHHDEFKALESLWQSTAYILEHVSTSHREQIEIFSCTKEELASDLLNNQLTQSAMYRHIYRDEYDTPGGEPIAAIISPYQFTQAKEDMSLLLKMSELSALSHSPFIANVSSQFFSKKNMSEIDDIEDITEHFERIDYLYWNRFREQESAKYIGLCLPKFVIRKPYQKEHVRSFCLTDDANQYLYAQASMAFAVNLAESFRKFGWCVNISGLYSGGKVDNLIVPELDTEFGKVKTIPTEIMFSETRELELSETGLIPLSYYKNSDFACFFSANSCKKIASYYDEFQAANARINTKLPYVFLSSRIAHFLKIILREHIGTNKNQIILEKELNRWLQTLVTKMSSPSKDLIATYPLREGAIKVLPKKDKPGIYQMAMQIVPHFQIEGVDVTLSLISEIPGEPIK